MKVIQLLIFCLLLYPLQPGFAQDYTPVIVNGEVFFSTQLLTSDGLLSSEVTVANFEKIDGVLYNRVFFKKGFGADELVGYAREIPELGEIYFRTTTNAAEYLVYAIGLEIGESVTLNARWCDGNSGDLATVVAINDIDGRRELVFDRMVGDGEICETLTFLEGIGPSAGLNFPTFRDEIIENGTAQTICHASRENVIFYPTTSEDLCGNTVANTEDVVRAAWEVFPNPVQDQLFFRVVPADVRIEVFSASGQLVATASEVSSLTTSHWPNGLYMVRLSTPDGINKVVRILKTQ